jgi:hypothetical protein
MLFFEKKSALVRLSDCIKLGIGNCLDTTQDLVDLHKKYEAPLGRIRAIAREILEGKISQEEGEERIAEENKNIPQEHAMRAISLKGRLHSECLSVLLNCCFALESYVNSLGYHLLQENDFLGLFRAGHDATAEVLIEAIEKMSTLSKWETLGKLKKGKGFDKSKNPYQDLKILFRFRDDMVHDKVADYSDEREKKRYNNKLPDPAFGFLDLRHIIYAADTYWGMISEIHTLIGIGMKEFHRHYNLKPWFTDDFEKEVRKTSGFYVQVTE